MKIVLAGPKGSGKTTVGMALARRLDIPFVDLDDCVVKIASGKGLHATTITEIFKSVGEREFRTLEKDAILSLDQQGYFVLATGGSTLLMPEARRLLRPAALWIYLQAPLDCLWERIKRGNRLPAYLHDKDDPQAAFAEHARRIQEVLSVHCDLCIDASSDDIASIVDDIVDCLNQELYTRSSAPNTLGDIIRLTTFGESHGPMIGAVLDGIRPGLPLSAEDIQRDLDRRRPGQSSIATSRNESDRVEIVSGVFEGKTTGTPIALLIKNLDSQSSRYETIKDLFRPGHADFAFWQKYGIRDYRGGGRSSGRETAARVAGGAIARKILAKRGVTIRAYTMQIGDIIAENIDYDEIDRNPVRCPDSNAAPKMEELILAAKKQGDSVGGIACVEIIGVPAGLGDPVFSKLDARLAAAFFSLGAVKGVEFGCGFACARMRGSEHNDQMENGRFLSNNAGGILGGISSGQPIRANVAIKPTPSVAVKQKTVDVNGNNRMIRIEGRHDPCIVPRIVPVLEAMAALILLDAWEVQERLRPGWTELSTAFKDRA